MNPYYGYGHTPINNPGYALRNDQGENEQVIEALKAGMKREASAIQLCSRLANEAPNQKHKYAILHAIEGKKIQLKQFNDLYIALTGQQPEYRNEEVSFDNYRDGLQRAYETEIEGYEEYRKSCSLSHHPLVRNLFVRACNAEQMNAQRFKFLKKKVLKEIKDFGGQPFVVDIEDVTLRNNTYRTALWTGEHLQVTLMCIDVGDDIGLEVHPTTDQFIRIEQGQGIVQMGDSKENLDFQERAYEDYAVMIPAGKWHNITNTGNRPLKVYAIYAPPEHPFGTVHKTKADAMAAEGSE